MAHDFDDFVLLSLFPPQAAVFDRKFTNSHISFSVEPENSKREDVPSVCEKSESGRLAQNWQNFLAKTCA